jgi:5-methyltetrahydropteroyltriglutamate--homocysteine methyltransferase
LIGANREVKKAVEAYWAGTITADQLTQAAADVKKSNWTSLKNKGVDYIPRLFHLSLVSWCRV